MKHLLTIIILLLAFTGCQRSWMHRELKRVDSLNQGEIPLDTVSTMKEVVDYFDRWGNTEEKIQAHYLLGCVFRDQKNVPMALRCFRDAVSLADTSATDCNFYRLSRIYGQMANLFHEQRVPPMEIEAELKAVEYAWRAKDTVSAVIFYCYLAPPYHMLNKLDSALYYNQRSIQLLETYGFQDMVSGLLPMSIDIYLRQKDYQSAKKALDDYERYTTDFSEDATRAGDLYYSYKGTYYESIGKTDSAIFYYKKLVPYSANLDNAEAVCKGLLSLYRLTGQSDSVAKYAELYCQANDSASFRHSADEIVRAQALYNYEEYERKATLKAKEADHYRRIVVISLIVLCIFAIAVYKYIRYQQRRKKAELMAANTEYASLLLQFSHVQRDLNLAKQNSDKFREEKEEEIRELQQRLAFYQEPLQMIEHWDIEQAMLNSSVVKQLHHSASIVQKPSEVQWKELRDFIEKKLPDFFLQLNSKAVMLSPREVLVGILIRLQFSQGELSALFGVSKQRINNIKSSINGKLFHEKGASTLDTNIMKM